MKASTVLLTAFLAVTSCGSKHEFGRETVSPLPAAHVQTHSVEIKARVISEEIMGTVSPKLHATLEAKLNGRIETMAIMLGQEVQKGQIIARLDGAEIAARLEQAEAGLEQAEREWRRVSALFEEQSVTHADYDSAQSRLRMAKGTVAEAKAMMSYVEILAPFDGVVTKKWAEIGDLATPGKPLADIEDPTSLQMNADVPEAIVSHIKRESRLDIVADSVQANVQGVVTEIAPAADLVSRTFRIKLDLPSSAGLMPGQFARLLVPIGERSALRIPLTGVVQRGQLEIVFAVADKRARLHLVKTGKRVGDDIEILSGLDGVEKVVVSGAEQLTDGQVVEAE